MSGSVGQVEIEISHKHERVAITRGKELRRQRQEGDTLRHVGRPC
jgi:hypothetical protein